MALDVLGKIKTSSLVRKHLLRREAKPATYAHQQKAVCFRTVATARTPVRVCDG